MSCNRIRDQLELFAGDDLAGAEAAAVAAHLRTCLSCYREYTDLRELLVTVRAAGRDRERGDAEVESLVAGVMREIHGPPPPAPRWIERVSLVSGWAAALLIGGALGWRLLVAGGAPAGEPDAPRRSGPAPVVIDHAQPISLEDDLARQLEELRRGGRSGAGRERPIPVAGPPKKNF